MNTVAADLHVHPAGSDRWRGEDDGFLEAIAGAGLALVALTDHDRLDVAAALVVESRDRGISTIVVAGEEISTRDGHLLGIGLTSCIPPGMSLADSVAAVHDQAALAVAAHPLLPTAISATGRLLAALAQGDPRRRPDAIEAFNPMAAWLPGEAAYVTRFARRHGYAISGGSDGHRPGEVGGGRTLFAGGDLADLQRAFATGATAATGRSRSLRDGLTGAWARVRDGDVRPGRR